MPTEPGVGTQHNPTEADTDPASRDLSVEKALIHLSDRQRRAFRVLTTGGTQADAAKEAGVTRSTVSLWTTKHPAMRAALNTWRHASAAADADRLAHIRELALSVVERAVLEGDVAVAVRALSLPRPPLAAIETAAELFQQDLTNYAIRVLHRIEDLSADPAGPMDFVHDLFVGNHADQMDAAEEFD